MAATTRAEKINRRASWSFAKYNKSMPSVSNRDSPFLLRPAPRDVKVSNWAIRNDPWRSIPALLLGVAAVFGAGYYSRDAWTCAIAGVFLSASLWRTWMPFQFEFHPRGVTQVLLGRRKNISWVDLGGYEYTPRGVILYGRTDPTRWGARPALFVFWAGQREAMTALIEYYLGGRLYLEEAAQAESTNDRVPGEHTTVSHPAE